MLDKGWPGGLRRVWGWRGVKEGGGGVGGGLRRVCGGGWGVA